MSDPESLYQEAQEYKHDQRMADKHSVYPCSDCGEMTHKTQLESVGKDELCKKCRGNLSECCGATVQDYFGWGVMDIVKEPEENMLGECSKCCKDQIYSKGGWQNYE